MTSERHCRFVELLCMVQNNVVGPATVFISHCWDAPFGDLIAAVCDKRSDFSIRVWLDIFSVLQLPSTKNEYEFELVIRKCPVFLIVCPAIPPELTDEGTEITDSRNVPHSTSSYYVHKRVRPIITQSVNQCVEGYLSFVGGAFMSYFMRLTA